MEPMTGIEPAYSAWEELARRMHTSGEPVSTIAATLGVSRATVYRVLGETGGQS